MSTSTSIRDTPRYDRSAAGMRWTTTHRVQVADLFCSRGGVGYAVAESPVPIEPNMHVGFDKRDFSDTYPGRFGQVDLLDDPDRTELAELVGAFTGPAGSLRVSTGDVEGPDLPRGRGLTADVVWVSFPCQAYSSLSPTHYGSREAALAANPRITDKFREFLLSIAPHYVIENVPGATRAGDLDANVRVNGLAFKSPDADPEEKYDLTRHFETTFPCPNAYRDPLPDEDYITVDTREDQSIKALAEAKGVPAEWGKQDVRSAIPAAYVLWVLHHCPSVPAPMPKRHQSVLAPYMDNSLGIKDELETVRA